MLRLAAVQMASDPHDPGGNIAQAAAAGADLALLPELALNGYALGPALWAHAEQIGGPLTRSVCEMARRHRLHLGTTIVEARETHFHNSFILAAPDGRVAGVVRKSRPAWVEARWYRGRPGPHVIDTALGRIGVGICYENYLSSSLRALAAAGVELVLQPTAAATPPAGWPVGKRCAAAYDRMLGGLAAVHARALGVPVVMANMVGPYPDASADTTTRFPGLSSIVDANGATRASLGGEESVIVVKVTIGEHVAPPSPVRIGRYWATPMPWYAPAWPTIQQLFALGYRLDADRRARAVSLTAYAGDSP